MKTAIILVFLMLFITSINLYAYDAKKIKIVFSLDQGFANGIISQNDKLAAVRVCRALKPLEEHYDVYLLVNPIIEDKEKLNSILDILVGMDMKFIFDVYSSDSCTIGSIGTGVKPYDTAYGISISMQELGEYKKKYGKHFAGLRIFETFAFCFTVVQVKGNHPEWLHPDTKLPEDMFFQKKIAEQFVKFAKDNDMFVQWSDMHTLEFASWDEHQKDRTEALIELLREYPNIIYVTYANNEADENSVQRLGYWEKAVIGFVNDGAKGFGLSNQSWIRKDETSTSIDEMIAWTVDAIEKGSAIVQFEPVWYWFNVPRGSFGERNSVEWQGMPRDNLKKLESKLLELAESKNKN
ncbi:MAG: hypothetical protein SNJ70_02430 [Armatimonadota bacterium]